MHENDFNEIKSIAKNIFKLRKTKKFTQECLSFKSQLSVNYLSMIERGVRTPTIYSLLKIAKSLNVPLAFLVDSQVKVQQDNPILNEITTILESKDSDFLKQVLKIIKALT